MNGEKIHEVTGGTPQVSIGPLRIMMNVWTVHPGSSGAIIWAGEYTHTGPQESLYDMVCHVDGETCSMSNCGTSGIIQGDPHFVGFNGLRFDFHGEHRHNYIVFAHQEGDILVAKSRATEELFKGLNKTYFDEFGLQLEGSSEKIELFLRNGGNGKKGSWKLLVSVNGRLLTGDTELEHPNIERMSGSGEVKVQSARHTFSFKAVSAKSKYRRHIDFKVAVNSDPDRSDKFMGVLGTSLSQKLGHDVGDMKWKGHEVEFELMMRYLFEVSSLFPIHRKYQYLYSFGYDFS